MTHLVDRLAPLPGFRSVLVHEYVAVDLDRVVAALADLVPIDEFYQAVKRILEKDAGD